MGRGQTAQNDGKILSPSRTPSHSVINGGFGVENTISLPPIINSSQLLMSKAPNNMSSLRPPSHHQHSSSTSSWKTSASSDLGVGLSSVSGTSFGRPATRSSISTDKFSRSSSSNALSLPLPVESAAAPNFQAGKLSPPFIHKRANSFNRSPKLQSVTFGDASPTKGLDENNVRQYQSLPRGISISGKRLKKLPASARKHISSPERLPSKQNKDG